MTCRDEEKRRQQKWLQKQEAKQARRPGEPPMSLAEARRFFGGLAETLSLPEPAVWPGASDLSLARPDRVKFELATFALKQAPGRGKYQPFGEAVRIGYLGFLPDIDHFAMEEFLLRPPAVFRVFLTR